MKTFVPALLTLSLLTCSTNPVRSASIPGVEFDGRQQGGVLALRGGTTGWEFTPLTDIVVDKLGLYDDHPSGGFAQDHTIGLWLADGTWITQVQIPAGEARPLEGNFRYVELTAGVHLRAYLTYVIAASYADGGSDRINNFSGPNSIDPNVRFDAIRNAAGFGEFRFPEGRDVSSGVGNFGPGFTFVPVGMPDPGDLAVEMRFLSGSYGVVDEPLDFSITVTNRSAVPASNVVVQVTNPLPGGLPFEVISVSQGRCDLDSGILVCALGNLDSGSSALISFRSILQNSGNVEFQSVVSSDTSDSIPYNNAATNRVAVYYPSFGVSGGGTVFEGGTLQFRLSLNPALSRPFIVSFATSNGTAMAGEDYIATNGSVVFAPGETVKTILVASVDDKVMEADESVNLVAVAPYYEHPLIGSGLIVDDDWPTAPFFDGFEEGMLSPSYWIQNAPLGAAFVTSHGQPHGGTNELALAPSVFGAGAGGGPVSITLRLNVGDLTNLSLSFWARYGPGSPQSFGLGNVGVGVSVDGVTLRTVPGVLNSLSLTHTHFVVPLDSILAETPLNSSGIIGITFFNNPMYYPPIFGSPPIIYNHSLFIDDIQVIGCPKDGTLKLLQPRLQSGHPLPLRFDFLACLGEEYQVEYSDDLSQPQWQSIETVVGDGFLKTIALPLDSARQRFYRVRTGGKSD